MPEPRAYVLGSSTHAPRPRMDTRYFSAASCLVRRNTSSVGSRLHPGRGVCRRHGLVAMLLVTDRSRVADAFGGVAVGVASALRVESGPAWIAPAGRRGGRGECRRVMVRPRSATLAPTADAGEGRRALSG